MPFGGGNVNIPVDKYGRVMVKHVADGDVNYTPWWVDGNQIALFDDAADQVLVDAMRDHGYVDCLSFTQVSDITVTIDGQSENLVFSSESKRFNMVVPGWQNAQANLMYRSFTLTGGTEISAVVDTASGDLAIIRNNGNDYFLKVVFDGSVVQALEMTLLSDYPEMSEATEATKLLGFFESSVPDQGDTDVLANTVDGDIFVIVLNQDGEYREGSARVPKDPTPTTDKATYRTLQWNGSTVKALCDVYGRIFTRYDSANDVYNGVAWTNEGIDKTFDSIDEHADAFLALIRTYGHNDAVTGEGVDNVVINLDGTSTEFTFTDGRLVPVSSAWANGSTPTLFRRTLNDGTNDVVVVCDADGKLVLNTNGEGYYIYNNEYDAINPRTINQSELVTAAGGSVLADTFGDNDGNYYLISLDGYTVCANDDGIVTVGVISVYPPSLIYQRGEQDARVAVDYLGRVLVSQPFTKVDGTVMENGASISQGMGNWAVTAPLTGKIAVWGQADCYMLNPSNNYYTIKVNGHTYEFNAGVWSPALTLYNG